MSRKFILAVALLLTFAVAAPAFAFNPQPDPPARHAANNGR